MTIAKKNPSQKIWIVKIFCAQKWVACLGVRFSFVGGFLAQAQPAVVCPADGVDFSLVVQAECVVLAEGDLSPLLAQALRLGQGVEQHALGDTQLAVVVETTSKNLVLVCLGKGVVASGPNVGEHGTPDQNNFNINII